MTIDQQEQGVTCDSRTTKPLRSDARRNRERLIEVASNLFATDGAEIPLEEIARHAGVGIGTLYRHFETREMLLEAVYRRRVEELCDSAPDLLATWPPVGALRTFLRRLVTFVGNSKGVAPALQAMMTTDSTVFDQGRERMTAAVALLLDAAIAQSIVRHDFDAGDILRIMGGICSGSERPGWHDQSMRLVDLVMDGLRYPIRVE